MSVWPAANQTRAPLGTGIIVVVCPSPAGPVDARTVSALMKALAKGKRRQ